MAEPDRNRPAASVGELLRAAQLLLSEAGVHAPRAEAERLLAARLVCDLGQLIARRERTLDANERSEYEDWVRRRVRREPHQHIVGRWEFHGLELTVDRRALIPRPETEGVVDAALGLDLPMGAAVADLGTGSGCIAVALAVRRSDLALFALDRSAAALELARENAERHGAAERIRFERADFAAPPATWRAAMHAVVSNPPYVAAAAWEQLEPEVRDYDPREALVPGPSGLEAYHALAPAACNLLRPGGQLVLELGHGQADAVRAILVSSGFDAFVVHADLQGIPRVLVARRSARGDNNSPREEST